jgi:hypothetical protein
MIKDLIAIIVVFSILGGVFYAAIKSKKYKSLHKNVSLENIPYKKNNVKGTFFVVLSILCFLWSIICFLGGPDANVGTQSILASIIFMIAAIGFGWFSMR